MSTASATERPKSSSPTSLGGLRPFMRPYRLQIGMAILFLMLRLAPAMKPHLALVILLGTAIPAILIIAEIIHRLIEKPGMAFGKKFDRR